MKTIYPFMGLALCSVTAQAQEKPNFLIIQCGQGLFYQATGRRDECWMR